MLNENNETYYALIADYYKDQAKRELVAVCIRYIHQGIIKQAVGFVANEDTSAAGVSKILEVIEPLQLDPSLLIQAGDGHLSPSQFSGHQDGFSSEFPSHSELKTLKCFLNSIAFLVRSRSFMFCYFE